MSTTTPSRTAVDLRVVELPALGAYADAWDALVAAAPLPSPFLRSWWIAGTAVPGTRLVVVLDGERLVGGLALERRRVLGVSCYRAAGGGKLCPDDVDVVAAPGEGPRVEAALQTWFTGRGARLLDIDGVAEDARLPTVLPGARMEQHDVALHGPLHADLEQYLGDRTVTFRKRMRRFERSAAAAGTTCRRVSRDEVPWAMEQFRLLHAPRADRAALLRHTDRLEQAVLRGADADEVRIYVAENDGRCGAVMLIFATGERFSDYQVARSLDHVFNHVGTVLTMAAVRDACAAGFTVLDYLRGNESYKRSLVGEKRALLRVRAAHGLRARALLVLLEGAERLRHRLGVAARRLGLRAAVPEESA